MNSSFNIRTYNVCTNSYFNIFLLTIFQFQFNKIPPDIIINNFKKLKSFEDIMSILQSCKHTKQLRVHHQFKHVVEQIYYSSNYLTHLFLDDKQVITTLNSLIRILLSGLYFVIF